MISASGTGCSAASRASTASAGGQLEHPSEVKSSTMIGMRSPPEVGDGDAAGAERSVARLAEAEKECRKNATPPNAAASAPSIATVKPKRFMKKVL
jgi:hypothetical protein